MQTFVAYGHFIPFKATISGTGERLMLECEYLYSSHRVLSMAMLQNTCTYNYHNNLQITLTVFSSNKSVHQPEDSHLLVLQCRGDWKTVEWKRGWFIQLFAMLNIPAGSMPQLYTSPGLGLKQKYKLDTYRVGYTSIGDTQYIVANISDYIHDTVSSLPVLHI